jgi:uncharacterized membrane protein
MAKDKEKKPQPVIVATFKSADAAAAAAQALKEAQKKKDIAYKAYAVVSRDEQKKLNVKETGDVGGIAGLVSGGLLGVVIAIIAGPVGWVAVAVSGATGGAIGGVAAKLIDSGVKSDEIKAVGEKLAPGSSAVIVLADEAAPVEAKLKAAGGEVATATIAPEVVDQAETHAAAEPTPAASAAEAPAEEAKKE